MLSHHDANGRGGEGTSDLGLKRPNFSRFPYTMWSRSIRPRVARSPSASITLTRYNRLWYSALARSNTTNKLCAKCGTPNHMASLQCKQCNTLQPLPTTIDYYDVLGMPFDTVPANGWRIDMLELKNLWRKTMAISHPDRLVHKVHDEQEIGSQQSAIVNKAYETLSSPLQRALYLLQRSGVESIEEGMAVEDPSLLMEVMELQEALQDAENQEAVDQVGATNQMHIDRVLDALNKAFSDAHPNTNRIRQLAVELRYWTNIDKAVREWQPGQRVELHH